MNRVEYDIQLRSIFNAAALIRQLKIKDVIDAMSTAESIAPIVDPSLYLKAARQMEWQQKIAQAALKFQNTVEQVILDYPSIEHP